MKKINNDLINDWLQKNKPDGKKILSIGARISESMVEKLACGSYKHIPKKIYREGISNVTGISEKKLFPGE